MKQRKLSSAPLVGKIAECHTAMEKVQDRENAADMIKAAHWLI